MPTTGSTTRDGSPRTKPAAERRRDLLDAGLAVFADRGVTAATVEDITRAAGVAKGTFYLHFESKEHLLAALQADFESRMVERLDAAAREAGDDPAGSLAAWLDAAFTHYPDDVALHDVLFHHPVLAGPADRDAEERRDLVDSLASVITEGCEVGVFDVDDVEITATLLCSALHHMFDRVWHRDGHGDVPRLRSATHVLFGRAVGAA